MAPFSDLMVVGVVMALVAVGVGVLVVLRVLSMLDQPSRAQRLMDRAAAEGRVGVRPDGRAEGTWSARISSGGIVGATALLPARVGELRLAEGQLVFSADGAEVWRAPASAVRVAEPPLTVGRGSLFPLRMSVPGVGEGLMVEVSLEPLSWWGEGDL